MHFDVQTLIALAIVVAAVAWIARSAYQLACGSSSGCGSCASKSCTTGGSCGEPQLMTIGRPPAGKAHS